MRTRLVKATLFTAGMLVASLPAHAQGYVELGGFGTYTKFDPTMGLKARNTGGARLTFASGEGLATFLLEGEASYYAFDAGSGITLRMLPGRARLAYAPSFGHLGLVLGGGAVRNQYLKLPGAKQAFHEWGYTGDVGLRLQMGNYMSFRVDGIIDYLTHPLNASPTITRNTNRTLQAGLSFPLWMSRSEPKPEPIPVAVAPAPAPRRDDVVEAPAKQPPLPDADGDGVPDGRDQCPATVAGASVDSMGCQTYRDTDGDGVIDPKDMCAGTAPGTAVDGHGCPLVADSDNDGVPDTRDRCPNTPAGTAVNSVGCSQPEPEADTDHDGVPDSRDRCPASPVGQPVDSTGCNPAPAPAAAPAPLFKNNERTVTLRGVNFAAWKDDLTQPSMAVLDDVARQLNDAPSIKVEVSGHTDNGGSYTRNVRLSLQRAEAVRAYLIMRGVAADRLIARGYGPDRPITSNATAAGRALNRRVEMKRVD